MYKHKGTNLLVGRKVEIFDISFINHNFIRVKWEFRILFSIGKYMDYGI